MVIGSEGKGRFFNGSRASPRSQAVVKKQGGEVLFSRSCQAIFSGNKLRWRRASIATRASLMKSRIGPVGKARKWFSRPFHLIVTSGRSRAGAPGVAAG